MEPRKLLWLGALLLVGCSAGQSRMVEEKSVAASATPASSEIASYSGQNAKQASLSKAGEDSVRQENQAVRPRTRQVIQNATLTVRVQKVREAEREFKQLLFRAGGYVESSSVEGSGIPEPTTLIVARVPVQRFDGLLEATESLGTLRRRQVGSEDVTGSIVDANARLKSMRVQEESYRQILARARKISDILEIQGRISEVRGRIESLDGQKQLLMSQAAMSTLTVTFESLPVANAPAKDPNWAVAAWANGTNKMGSIMRSATAIAIYNLALAPVWLALAVASWFGWRRFGRRIRRALDLEPRDQVAQP